MCPRADRDYWKYTGIGGDKQLLSVDLLYEKLSPTVELQADVWGPRGRCMPNALTACTTNESCAPSFDFCDSDRGGCRAANAPVCFKDSDCTAGESCYGAQSAVEQIAQVRIPPTSVLQHRLTANYAAFAQGDYTVIVYDHAEREEEPEVEYQLTVTTQTDPDVNEPNDLRNLATPLVSGTGVEGAMSYVDDVDWFVITPAFSTPAVVRINLTYSSSSVIAPTWTIVQGNFQYVGPNTVTEGSGGTAIRRQSAGVVTPTNGPVLIRVENAANATNTTDRYNLVVDLTDDPQEGAVRNDEIANATNLNAGTATAPPGANMFYNQTDRILVALNDTDWYRIARSAAIDDNTLLHFINSAAASAPYSLVFQMYRPTAQACSALNQCTQGRPCSPEGVCLDLMVQRPAPDGPGDPQLGGLSPNYIETQLPMLADVVYVRVVNSASTLLDVPGYDFTKANPYRLTIEHIAEPDPGDAANPPDNRFLSRPFDADAGDFSPRWRDVTGGDVIVQPSNPGSPMAVARAASVVNGTAASCTTVTLDVYDGLGRANATSRTIDLSGSGGATFEATCGNGTPTTQVVATGASTTVGLVNTGGGAVTLTASIGGVGVSSYLPTTNATNFQSQANTAAQRGAAADSASAAVRVRLPAVVGSATTINLVASGGGQITCVAAGTNPNCPNDDTTADYCDPTAGQPDCHVIIPTGGQTVDVRVNFPNPGAPQTLTATWGGSNTGIFQWVVYTPGEAVSSGGGPPYSIQGFISYDGDQDFFEVVPPNPPGLGAGGITIFVDFPASEVDLRAQATRGGGGAGVGNNNDVCEEGCGGGGTCNTQRQTCRHAAFNESAGPTASDPECVYTGASGGEPIRIWVNDVNSNDWEEVQPYTIRVEYFEGCPGVCPAAACQ